MAGFQGMQSMQDPTTLGIPASFVYDDAIIFPGVERPVFTGSQLGVPPVDRIAGETTDTGSSSASEYGSATAVKAPHKQPIFWSVVMVVAGVVLLTHAARLNVRA